VTFVIPLSGDSYGTLTGARLTTLKFTIRPVPL